MAQIILDFGSGNTCKNDMNYINRMIDELKAVDTGKHEIVIKWQLFGEAGANVPLSQEVFGGAYILAKRSGYKTTASVFDLDSLECLLSYEVPFVKIANRPDLYWLAEEVPRKIPVYISHSDLNHVDWNFRRYNNYPLLCVSEYPTTVERYQEVFDGDQGIQLLVGYGFGVSDHTTNFELYNEYKPNIIEWHYKLDDSTGLDAGPFARTPEQLQEVL